MKDKFSLYQADGFWGIIEDSSDEKQTSVKSYIGADLIIKRLNEQAKQIDQLKQQLAEKDKEIEELNKTLEMCKHIERYDIGEMFLENAKLIIEKRQLAIQELEKVKTLIQNAINFEKPNFVEVYDAINKQIKELKGEKDVKD